MRQQTQPPQLHEWFEDMPGQDEPTRPSRSGVDLSHGDTEWLPEAFAWPWAAVTGRQAALATFLFLGEVYGKRYSDARRSEYFRDIIPPQKKCSAHLFRGLVLGRIAILENDEQEAELSTAWMDAAIEEIEDDPRFRTFRAGFDWAFLIRQAMREDRISARLRAEAEEAEAPAE
jgi:hypothetical protein